MLGSCPGCWDHICCCGYQYIHWNTTELESLITTLRRIQTLRKMQHPVLKDTSDVDAVLRAIRNAHA